MAFQLLQEKGQKVNKKQGSYTEFGCGCAFRENWFQVKERKKVTIIEERKIALYPICHLVLTCTYITLHEAA